VVRGGNREQGTGNREQAIVEGRLYERLLQNATVATVGWALPTSLNSVKIRG